MVKNRPVASLMAAIPVAVVISMSLAYARDSSLCAPNGSMSAQASASGELCAAALDQVGLASADGHALDHAAATPVITEPVTRSSRFVYRLRRAEEPSGETMVLLHGSGGDEASLFKLAAHVAPDATLLGVRGRVVQKGLKRWYARVSPIEFDQADIRAEARAFAGFLKERMAAERLDLERTVFIGYSNGANLIAAMTLFYPDLVRRAVLLRAMPVLDAAPAADLHRARFLSVPGKVDVVYGPFAQALETLLRDRGAAVESRMVASGHLLGDEDFKVVGDWLKAANTVAGGAAQ